jgi:hypothetical protein
VADLAAFLAMTGLIYVQAQNHFSSTLFSFNLP